MLGTLVGPVAAWRLHVSNKTITGGAGESASAGAVGRLGAKRTLR